MSSWQSPNVMLRNYINMFKLGGDQKLLLIPPAFAEVG